jgi:hypothetical protein
MRARSIRHNRQGGPAWWVLYVIAGLLIGVVGLVETRVDGQGLRTILEVLAVVSGFGLFGLWRRSNRIALELEQGRRRA